MVDEDVSILENAIGLGICLLSVDVSSSDIWSRIEESVMMQDQSQGENRVYPGSSLSESNNPMSSLAVLLCGFYPITSMPWIHCRLLLL
jgi:hypothetical protein